MPCEAIEPRPVRSGSRFRPRNPGRGASPARPASVGSRSMCWTSLGDAGASAACARQLDHQRHANRLVVHEQPVFSLGVIAQPFAVIRRDRDRRLVVPAVLLQRGEKLADDLVRERHLAIVLVRLREPRRRCVRRVRLIDVKEHEKAIVRHAVQPRRGGSERRRAGSKDLAGRLIDRRPAAARRRSARIPG